VINTVNTPTKKSFERYAPPSCPCGCYGCQSNTSHCGSALCRA
jgi:hypothetical protein